MRFEWYAPSPNGVILPPWPRSPRRCRSRACTACSCVAKIGGAIGTIDGLTAASANVMGEVSIRYDEADPDTRRAVVDALAAAGFPVAAG